MKELSVKDLLEAGCHFGHQTARWNPRMEPYIFTVRNGVHILDLDKTVESAQNAYKFVADRVALGDAVIFVGTKKQASDIIREQAERVNMYYVNQRWLGGMLTNFSTIKKSIDWLQNLYQRRDSGEFAKLTKKEALGFEREIEKMEKSFGGIKTMTRLPKIVFIVDPKAEHIAKNEANRLKLPIIAITDTNCDPAGIDHVIPANDDAIRSIGLLVSYIADACAEGLERREAVIREDVAKEEVEKGSDKGQARVREKKMTGKAKAYTAEARPMAHKGGKGKFKGSKEDEKPAEPNTPPTTNT